MIMAKYSDKSATKIFLFIQSSLDFSKKKNDSLLFLYLIPLFRMFPVSYTRYTQTGHVQEDYTFVIIIFITFLSETRC